MKVSLNLAQEFSNVDLKSIPRDELLQRIGAQLGAVEDVVDWAPKFEGAVIVRIVECDKHENADKLSVCRVDDGGQDQSVERGEDGLIQVVCGAPNARADMYAVWLPPGATVPNSRDTDPFVLEAREIRGVVSNGMLASAYELGISDNHDGIVEITESDLMNNLQLANGEELANSKEQLESHSQSSNANALQMANRQMLMPEPGSPLVNLFGLDDYVIDCENKMFTHRPDCFGVLGVARELAGITGQQFASPDWYLSPPAFEEANEISLQATNDIPDLVPRFMAVVLRDVTVRPSPMWLQAALARVGIKPINNVVDISNYVMHLTGQPTHAFDYDKISERSNVPGIFPRLSEKGEKIVLLGQKEIELTGEEIVIATDKQAVALAGVMGGLDTEVDENTKNIIIECATFDMYSIRRTSMRYGLFTDAVTRYNKGQSPLQNHAALSFLMRKMNQVSGAKQASKVLDVQSSAELHHPVEVTAEFINARLGSDLPQDEIKTILENVEISVEIRGDTLLVTPPFWRMDIEIPEDIVEEVGRLYGYDRLPVNLPVRSAQPTAKNQLFEFKYALRQKLSQAGANEVLTYSFVHGDLLKKTNIDPEAWTYHIRNAISPDLQYYRPSLMPSLLAKVHPNIKAQAGSDGNQFALFEIGKAHIKGEVDSDGLPVQMERLALVVAADDKTVKSSQAGAAYYLAKKYLDTLTGKQASMRPLEDFSQPLNAPYAKGRSAAVYLDDKQIGVIGEFNPAVRQALKLPEFCAGFELDIELLAAMIKPRKYQPLPEFPGTSKDYTHEVSSDVSWYEVLTKLTEALHNVCYERGYQFDVEPLDIFQPENSDKKRFTFRIQLHHPNKTLTTEEATQLVEAAASQL